MQARIEQVVSRFPQVAYVFSKTGTAEVATDPMPPNSSDAFVILKPQDQWPDPSLSKAELQEQIEAAVGKLAGNVYEFSQPIQLRFMSCWPAPVVTWRSRCLATSSRR
ncbi:hypothetical protein GCM10025880_68440 [Methylorubrum aminovorans]|nr:hypothetical protein GCM10025880_68440 [Methylorubrum aminovorans]